MTGSWEAQPSHSGKLSGEWLTAQILPRPTSWGHAGFWGMWEVGQLIQSVPDTPGAEQRLRDKTL